MKYPYVGNVQGHKYENTFCPECGERVMARDGYTIVSYKVTSEKRCPKCGTGIPIAGLYVQKGRTSDQR